MVEKRVFYSAVWSVVVWVDESDCLLAGMMEKRMVVSLVVMLGV